MINHMQAFSVDFRLEFFGAARGVGFLYPLTGAIYWRNGEEPEAKAFSLDDRSNMKI